MTKKRFTSIFVALILVCSASANADAIKEYVESDEFKKAVEDYKASEKYVDDYSQYIAHDDGSGKNYLGQINQGDVISFVFNSDKATKGSFAFRLASSYLYKDNNGGWLAAWVRTRRSLQTQP